MIGHIIGWIIAGLIVGAVARLLVPGRQNMGVGLTIVLGIVGAMVGGFIGSMLFGPNSLQMRAVRMQSRPPGPAGSWPLLAASLSCGVS